MLKPSERLSGSHIVVGAMGAIVGTMLLYACAPTTSPAAPTGERIISVSATMGFLAVTKQAAGGALSVCLYESNMRPGDTYQPRGCQTLPPQ